jgi:hypothetical protein
MLNFQWNALRVGDPVVVHHPDTSAAPLVAGVVAMVDIRKRQNGVGIRVAASDGGSEVLWPAPLVVHPFTADPTESCWRCDALAIRRSA